MLSKIWMIS